MDINGKVAVVTGATGGLGWQICQSLAAEGAKLSMVYFNSKEKAEAQKKQLDHEGMQSIIVQADVRNADAIHNVYQATEQAFGGIDILILDAAYNESIPFADLDALSGEKWETILNYNLTAPYLAVRAVAPYMKKRDTGRIVTISSVGGNLPASSSIAYSVSKAGLQHLSRCLAVALGPQILVNDVAPGLIGGTRMTNNLREEHINRSIDSSLLKKTVAKEDVATAVINFCKNDSMTGQSLVVDCGRFFK